MRAVVQRVRSAAVRVGGESVGAIGPGMLVLVGAETGDGTDDVAVLAEKLAGLRIFEDDAGKMNRDAKAADAAFLIVSQFTLAASLSRGRRPSFNHAAHPEVARPLVEALMVNLRGKGFEVAGGRFGAQMAVELVNDGPVTFVLAVREGRVRDS